MALEKQLSVFFFFSFLSQPPEGHGMFHSGSGEPMSTLGGGVKVQRGGRQCGLEIVQQVILIHLPTNIISSDGRLELF